MLNTQIACPHCGKPVATGPRDPECCVYREREIREMLVHEPRQLARRLYVIEHALQTLIDAQQRAPRAAKVA